MRCANARPRFGARQERVPTPSSRRLPTLPVEPGAGTWDTEPIRGSEAMTSAVHSPAPPASSDRTWLLLTATFVPAHSGGALSRCGAKARATCREGDELKGSIVPGQPRFCIPISGRVRACSALLTVSAPRDGRDHCLRRGPGAQDGRFPCPRHHECQNLLWRPSSFRAQGPRCRHSPEGSVCGSTTSRWFTIRTSWRYDSCRVTCSARGTGGTGGLRA